MKHEEKTGVRVAIHRGLLMVIHVVALLACRRSRMPAVVFLLATFLMPVRTSGGSGDTGLHCAAAWSIDGLRLGMTRTELEELHSGLEHSGMYGNDELRARNKDEGTWYRWRADTATGRRWHYASIDGSYASSPVVAITLVRDFHGWDDDDLQRSIAALVDDFGSPSDRDIPLKSTRYARIYGTSKGTDEWMAVVWDDEDCDVMATAMYGRTRYGSARVTALRIALTTKEETTTPSVDAEEPAPVEGSCDRWGLGSAGRQALREGRDYLRADDEDEGWRARRRIESLSALWGAPARDSVPVNTTQHYRLFGFPHKKESKWRATVWEDESCDVVATAFYREFKRTYVSEFLVDSKRYPVTRFVLVLHSPGKTPSAEPARAR